MFRRFLPVLFLLFILFVGNSSCYAQNIFDLVRKGNTSAVEQWIKSHPESLNIPNEHGYTLLMLAAYHGHLETTRFLVKIGADVDGKSNYGTPVMAATIKGKSKIVAVLLTNGADPNIPDKNGTTALLYASIFSLNDIAEQLLKAGANPTLKDDKGNMALDYAVLTQNEILIKILNQYQ